MPFVVKFRTSWVWTWIIASLLAGCVSNTASNTGRVVISGKSSELIYSPRKTDGLELTFYEENSTSGNFTSQVVVGRTQTLFPHSSFRLIEVNGGYHFTNPLHLIDYVESLNFVDKGVVKPADTGSVHAYYGFVEYLEFKAQSASCVAMINVRNNSVASAVNGGTARLYGHYCTPPDQHLSKQDIAEIANSLGWRSNGVPEHLAEAAADTQEEQSQLKLPLRIRWTGYNEDLSVTLFSDSKRGSGRHWFALPSGEGDCTGEWKSSGGEYDGSSDYPHGNWTFLCTNGRSASGSYVSLTEGSGFGEGGDVEGNKIILDFGPPPSNPVSLSRLPENFVCLAALSVSSGPAKWSTNLHATPYVKEALSRSLNAETCKTAS